MFKTSRKDPMVNKLVNACYPDYRGRRFFVNTATRHRVWDFWDRGSRDYTTFYNLATGQIVSANAIAKGHPEAMQKPGNPYNLPISQEPVELPDNVVVVLHSIFCGKDRGIRIIVRPDNLGKFLPETTV